MSRDKRLNRTQEVDGSSPFSSTNRINNLAGARASALLFLRKLSELRPHRARSLAAGLALIASVCIAFLHVCSGNAATTMETCGLAFSIPRSFRVVPQSVDALPSIGINRKAVRCAVDLLPAKGRPYTWTPFNMLALVTTERFAKVANDLGFTSTRAGR